MTDDERSGSCPTCCESKGRMTMDKSHGAAAVELYRMVSGSQLDAAEAEVLREMLTVGPDDRWASARVEVGVSTPSLLDARAIAGLFLFGENVVWSAYRSAWPDFERLRGIIEGSEALRLQVRRASRAAGDLRISLHGGNWIRFTTRYGLRGLTAGCVIIDDALEDGGDPHHALAIIATHGQLVINQRVSADG